MCVHKESHSRLGTARHQATEGWSMKCSFGFGSFSALCWDVPTCIVGSSSEEGSMADIATIAGCLTTCADRLPLPSCMIKWNPPKPHCTGSLAVAAAWVTDALTMVRKAAAFAGTVEVAV